MEIWTTLSLCLTMLLTLFVVLWFLWDQSRRASQNQSQSETLRNQTQLQSLTLQSQNQLSLVAALDKAMALLSTTDPLTFQQVQVMNPSGSDVDDSYDPSDEGEILRIQQRNKDLAEEGDLSAYERGIASELGLDPEFFVSH